MSAIVTLTPAPAAMEERLAALGIPVNRLIAAARIARADRWAAAKAAFVALVAEATPTPLARGAAEPVTLTGSSVPTGAPPSFVPVATARPETAPDGDRRRTSALAEETATDPIEVLHDGWKARRNDFRAGGFPEADEDAMYDRVTAVEDRVMAARATTLAGAITSLEWARSEIAEFKTEGLLGDRLILALLDGALGVMKDSKRVIAVPEATADVAELTARWVQSASEVERDSKMLDAIEDTPAWWDMIEVARERGTTHRKVLRAIADLRSTAVDVMALKAAALLDGRRGPEGLDREIAWDEPEVGDITTSLALSLSRDVIALLGAPVQRLVAAVEAGSVSTDLDARFGPLVVNRGAA